MRLPFAIFTFNTEYFIKWLGPVFICLYVVLEAHNVIHGKTSVGAYIATVNVIKVMVANFEVGVHEIEGFGNTLLAMSRMVKFFNMDTEVRRCMEEHKERRAMT